jgi:hypothetical protein
MKDEEKHTFLLRQIIGEMLYSEVTTKTFDTLVRTIQRIPHPEISILGEFLWHVINKKIILVVKGPVDRMYFCSDLSGDFAKNGCIVLPENFVSQVKEDHLYAIGGLIFVGSQAKDLYYKKLTKDTTAESVARAIALESEYIQIMRRDVPEHELNIEQAETLRKYPLGLRSVEHLLYVPDDTNVNKEVADSEAIQKNLNVMFAMLQKSTENK